jgi:hypothetical protein
VKPKYMTLTKNLTKGKKIYYLVAVLVFGFTIFLGQGRVSALSRPCDNADCRAYRAGWYSCQSQTFCCYGGGCPSQCAGCGTCKVWYWDNDCPKTKCVWKNVCRFIGHAPWVSCKYEWVCTTTHNGCSRCKTQFPCECACVSCGDKEPPPPGGNVPPTCTAITGTTTNIYAGSPPDGPFTYKATATDSDGTVDSYTWSIAPVAGTLTAKSANQINWTPPIAGGGAYNVNCTVTDNDGLTDACPALPVTVISDFNLVVTTKLKNATDACGANLTTLPNVNIQAFSGATSLGSGKTNASGQFTVSNLSRKIGTLKVCANYAPTGTCTTYGINTNCLAGATADGCVQVAAPAAGNATVLYQIEENKRQPWVVAVNGNVQANTVGGNLPCSSGSISGNFKPNLINFTDPTAQGYIFTRSTAGVLADNYIESIATRGGWAINVNDTDAYLDKLSFKAPNSSSTVEITTASLPTDPGVYKISVANFNKITESGTPVTFNISSASKFALLYVEGDTGEVVVNAKISGAVAGNNLLIVTDLPVRITKDVGELPQLASPTYVLFSPTVNPDVQAGIISSHSITVEADSAAETDRAIMLQGPFVSLDKLFFNRDAGYHNDEFPPQAVKYNPMYLYFLTNLERTHPLFKSYTGLGIYDIQWLYEE